MLSPNAMFKVVASYTSEHLRDLRGFQFLHVYEISIYLVETIYFTIFSAGLLDIPENVDMIILREIGLCDEAAHLPSDNMSPYKRRQRPDIDATTIIRPALHDIKIAQPSDGNAEPAVSHRLVDVDFFDTDSAASDFHDSANSIGSARYIYIDATNIARPVSHDIYIAQPSLGSEHEMDC